jgi:predicted dehydrogenase
MTKHRIAIVGTGASVGNHLKAAEALRDRADLVAAVDLDEARVKTVCEQANIPHWYTSVTDMLAAEKPDIVSIVTPPATHKDIAIQCLEAGSWVYCEKPLCASLAEFKEIEAAEQRTARYVSTVFQWRFGSAGKHLKQLIQNEAFGKPMVVVCNTLWYRTHEYYSVAWRGKYETEFGGPTMTLGIHLMDFVLWLMDDWQEVRAMTGTLDRNIEVEDVSMAMVRFGNGAMGSFINSSLSPHQESYIRLDFQKATLEMSGLYRYTNDNWKINLPPNIEDAATLQHWTSLSQNIISNHEIQLGEILDALETNQRPPVSGAEGQRIIEFAASLYKSAATRQTVYRGDITPDDPFYYSMSGKPELKIRS